ncbi:MAG: hypothetical protein MI919_12660 [Holophagales bacterium]|nr:hypothetical protein [Holophagales bacterium]
MRSRSSDDVVTYMRLWADLLEDRWLAQQEVPTRLPAMDHDLAAVVRRAEPADGITAARLAPARREHLGGDGERGAAEAAARRERRA